MAHLMADSRMSNVPSDDEIQNAVRDITGDATTDLEELSLKKCMRMVSSKLGCSIDVLHSKKDLIKNRLEMEVRNHNDPKEEDVDILPTKEEIQKAAQELTTKVNVETTSFKKFMKLLADDLDVEDLSSDKQLIKKVYDAAAKDDSDATPDLPSDETIVMAAKKLACSSRVDLEDITKAKFLHMLEKKMGGVDLSSKKKLVTETLLECKTNHSKNYDSLRVDDLDEKHQKVMDDSFASSTMSNTENRQYGTEEILIVPAFSIANDSSTKPEQAPIKVTTIPRCSLDLEQGRNIQQAADLKWIDDFFDDDTDELVAVFDHDYSGMIHYEMKIVILNKVVPIAVAMLFLFVLIGSSGADGLLVMAILIIMEIPWLCLTVYGHYRIIRSTIRAYHVAILRDGIRAVHDDHIWSRIGVLGAFPCLDSCLLVSKQSETIPFDQLTKLTVKSPGEVNRELCCWCCCAACLKIPYFTVALDTGSSNPYYYERCMDGLLEPQKFEKLAWAMKRENYEHVHRETHEILKANHNEAIQSQMNMEQMMMFDTMMKYGMSPGMSVQQIPNAVSTVPSSSTMISSSVRSPMSSGRMPPSGGNLKPLIPPPPTTY